ncbi:MAG: DUF202 domain-containing protein [Bacteroidota bacterium]|nr:DUF202 domain-containing protein [Bacteroidota bacterium]
MSEIENKINKDLILRERLALQRTVLANQTALLSFLRTGLYFLVAGLSIGSIIKIKNSWVFELSFFVAASLIVIIGVVNYYRQKLKIKDSEKHIGDYKFEYLKRD